ncbi:alpha/beta hydrolase [Sinimarinibacterium thermocellulolyticum]|uniref:Alpha/beta hydrolase fold domain-containing protein n=1 Tax=Sinimarinibacterium thermocellulolyticum TaxID=3170016 RepID=A0ABV2A6J9_9GAMM
MISRSLAFLLALAVGACSSPRMMNRMASEEGYKLAENLPYERSRALDADVYYPPQASDAPIIVFFYGGRWQQGDKAEYRFVGQALASRGYVAVLPNVRKYPQVRFPEFMDDAARAVKWARENARQFGGNPDKLFVMGHSSGAHIAALLALNPEYLQAVGGSREWLRGMIGLAGAYDFMPITAPDLRDLFGPVDRFRYSQPVFYVDGQNPPLLLMHGRNDEVLWVSNTENLAARVAKAGGAVETVLYDSLSHSMIIGALASYLRGRADVLDNIEEFVDRISSKPRPPKRETEIQAVPLIADPLPAPGSAVVQEPEPSAPLPLELPPIELTPAPPESPTTPEGATPGAGAEDDPWAFLGPVPTSPPARP